GIFGNAADLAAIAAFFSFVLLGGIHAPLSSCYASHTKFLTGSHFAKNLVLFGKTDGFYQTPLPLC
ncbi:MAG: hypothetical protein AB3X44_13435, partial [Leptothrix sp. (in: b-proteobacteria)]